MKTMIKNFCEKQSMSSFKLIENNIGLITLNNHKKRNALSNLMISSLSDNLKMIDSMHKEKNYPRVVILSSESEIFSAGHDLKEIYASDEKGQIESFQGVTNLIYQIQNSPAIIIAEVLGLATAAGCQIVASTDLSVGTSESKYACPGIKVGLACHTPGVAVGKVLNKKRALQMILTGEPISAHQALDWGLINEVVDTGRETELEKKKLLLRTRTLNLANIINQYEGKVLSYGKSVFYKQISESQIEKAYKIAEDAMINNLKMKPTQEGIKGFINKLKVTFNNKL